METKVSVEEKNVAFESQESEIGSMPMLITFKDDT